LSPQGVGTIYVDGVNLTTDSTVSPVVAGTQALLIGSRGGIDEFFLGSIDELRISATQRSAAWISAQYRSMTQTFASFGPEHTQGTLSAMTSLNLDPLAVQLTFDSTPQQGLQLTAGTTTAPTPFASTFIVGSHFSVSALSQMGLGGQYAFTSWSDGGAATHLVTAPAAPQTFTAAFHLAFECADGIDNDGDGKVDYPADPGCKDAGPFSVEAPACSDGIDNDGDGKIDYPADPDCEAPWGTSESPRACGTGVELCPLLAGLWLARRRVAAAATRAAPSR